LVSAALVLVSSTAAAQSRPDPVASVPVLGPLVGRPASELADVIERFSIDRTGLNRRYDADDSPDQRRRMREFYAGWQTRLKDVDFVKLSQEARADYVLLAHSCGIRSRSWTAAIRCAPRSCPWRRLPTACSPSETHGATS